MTHLVQPAFRQFLLSALLLLLPAAASAFAASQVPAIDPTIAPVTRPGTAPDDDDEDYDDEKTLTPGTTKTAAAVSFGAVSVSVAPAPFLSAEPGDQIVREFIVRNDGATPADFTVVMRYDISWNNDFTRSVTTSRKIPAHSIQTVSVFVPTHIESGSMNLSVAKPQIFINGRELHQLPSGIFDTGEINSRFYPMPSSFKPLEPLMKSLIKELCNRNDVSYRDLECGFSSSDTVQWPAIPQFYQAKDVLFRKTTDNFTPDAERAIHDAVMLGATEFLFVPRDSRRPEWVPAPEAPGLPVVVPRGFGRTIVLDENTLFVPMQGVIPPGAAEEPYHLRRRNEDANVEASTNGNRNLLDYLKQDSLFNVNPAVQLQMLPCVDIPNMSFALVILALLAYIVVVGPVNYFYLMKRKKSVLMLLLTVPVISLLFVGIVILFVSFFEGWFSRASAVGMTFLDQQENMAYTRAAVNLYAPLPVRRLVFDTADTVSFARAKDANVYLGRDQVVTGANRARVPLIYGISRAEKHLEQLKISRGAGDSLIVMNGLGTSVRILAMKTPDGMCWVPPDHVIPPGVSAELKPFSGTIEPCNAKISCYITGTRRTVDYALGRNHLFYTASMYLFEKTPQEYDGNTARKRKASFFTDISNVNMMKEVFQDAQKNDGPSPFASVLSPGMYVAETDRPLFYSPGCSPVSFRARHLVIGTFTLQESAHEN